jgi:two-component system NtrC family sensor kinase
MQAFTRYLKDLYSGPFQVTLVFAFTLVAALTVGIGSGVISHTIDDYLAETMAERVDRDIHLAETFYNLKLNQISGIASRLALHPHVVENLAAASRGDIDARDTIDEEILNKVRGLTQGGNHFVAVLDAEGNVLVGRLISTTGEQQPIVTDGHWSDLPIVRETIAKGTEIAAAEVIPAELLTQVGLAEQAYIKLIDTPRAAAKPFDPREGSAGLTLVSAAPIVDANSRIVGAAIVLHLVNNDFTLVDQIKDAAQVDTVTIFMGDLRVSTNVPMTAEGQRAVGTRLSQEVGDVVLYGEQNYVGTAFVVNQDYITHYEPLRDHTGQVIGILYVGARQASFQRLVNTFRQRIALVAALTFISTFIIATPVSRWITRPLKELRELVQASRRVAGGDLSARAPVIAGGEVGQVASAFNEMLDTLQTTQDQLVQSEKLASLGQLAAGVAHELNNPLATVLLFSDVMLRESNPDERRRADLETIVRETQRCKTIVAALLNFARQHQIDIHETDLNELIQRVIRIEEKHIKYANVEIITELNPNLPKIQADPAQLQAVLINLMSNAAEAMPEGGQIALRTRPGPPGMITVQVEDTGAGIAPENLPRLFTPFFTTKPLGKGTGLGLAIVYGIIKMHRGQINAQSQVGKGTVFSFNLPIKLPGVGAPTAPPNNNLPVGGTMIG